MAGNLEIHLIGEGYGESIILQCPNGKVGVLDCFSRQLVTNRGSNTYDFNPVVRFLRRTLKVSRLAFVGFTHPHEDHGRGLSHVLKEYEGAIDEIWMYDTFTDDAFRHWLNA